MQARMGKRSANVTQNTASCVDDCLARKFATIVMNEGYEENRTTFLLTRAMLVFYGVLNDGHYRASPGLVSISICTYTHIYFKSQYPQPARRHTKPALEVQPLLFEERACERRENLGTRAHQTALRSNIQQNLKSTMS